jgi:hypothetical protein
MPQRRKPTHASDGKKGTKSNRSNRFPLLSQERTKTNQKQPFPSWPRRGPTNQPTKQPSNQATKQPSNQAHPPPRRPPGRPTRGRRPRRGRCRTRRCCPAARTSGGTTLGAGFGGWAWRLGLGQTTKQIPSQTHPNARNQLPPHPHPHPHPHPTTPHPQLQPRAHLVPHVLCGARQLRQELGEPRGAARRYQPRLPADVAPRARGGAAGAGRRVLVGAAGGEQYLGLWGGAFGGGCIKGLWWA